MRIELFTDGSSYIKNDMRASASAYTIYINDKIIDENTKFYLNGTNNLAETDSILLGLNRINKFVKKLDKKYSNFPIEIDIISDSLITCQALREYIYKWLKKSRSGILYNSAGEEVANQDMIKEIYKKYLKNDDYDINFYHVKSHKIEHRMYKKYIPELKEYYRKRHSKKDLIKPDLPDELFSREKFRKARKSFLDNNNISINNFDLLRLLIYNKRVDELAGDALANSLNDSDYYIFSK